eukprot:6478516-Amphidinium_carterae.1
MDMIPLVCVAVSKTCTLQKFPPCYLFESCGSPDDILSWVTDGTDFTDGSNVSVGVSFLDGTGVDAVALAVAWSIWSVALAVAWLERCTCSGVDGALHLQWRGRCISHYVGAA